MQSESAPQLVLQAVVSQMYGLQLELAGAGHAPAPSQLADAVAVPLPQLAPRHCAVGYAQAAMLLPSQLPPHVLPSLAQAARAPPLRCGAPDTGVHWPTEPATSQAWHCPLHAWLQQTPSAQLLLAHSCAPPQARPSAFFATHWPAPSQ